MKKHRRGGSSLGHGAMHVGQKRGGEITRGCLDNRAHKVCTVAASAISTYQHTFCKVKIGLEQMFVAKKHIKLKVECYMALYLENIKWDYASYVKDTHR